MNTPPFQLWKLIELVSLRPFQAKDQMFNQPFYSVGIHYPQHVTLPDQRCLSLKSSRQEVHGNNQRVAYSICNLFHTLSEQPAQPL